MVVSQGPSWEEGAIPEKECYESSSCVGLSLHIYGMLLRKINSIRLLCFVPVFNEMLARKI